MLTIKYIKYVFLLDVDSGIGISNHNQIPFNPVKNVSMTIAHLLHGWITRFIKEVSLHVKHERVRVMSYSSAQFRYTSCSPTL